VLGTSQIAVSNLTIAETKNALVRKLKHGRLTASEVDIAHAAIDQHLAAGLYLYFTLPESVFRHVPELSLSAPVFLRTADALHLAMAQHVGADLGTFDRDLRLSAQARGMTTLPLVTV
jgi:predicted nucleic acid-binding protein